MPSIPRIKAYKGKGHYIFVSYSHDNKDTVYPFIAALQKKYNVWFDDGLHYGKEFEDELAEKLEGCSLFVFMVSNESLESDFCKEELFYAREQRKPFVNILTEDNIALPGWFRLRCGRYQMCHLYQFQNPDVALEELESRCEFFDLTRKTESGSGSQSAHKGDDDAERRAAEKARLEAEEKARREAEEKARLEAEEKARREAEEKARRDAEARARRKAEKEKKEAEERARREAEAAAAAAKSPSELAKGDVFRFGSYVQSESGSPEPIEWLVLSREGNEALLISRLALDCKPYNPIYAEETWEECSLRKWLNEDFLSAAFSEEEQSRIVVSAVKADANPSYSSPAGNDTSDRIFLLSVPEANEYFDSEETRICAPTEYAKKQGAFTNKKHKAGNLPACWWWLRTPGFGPHLAAYVGDDGSTSNYGSIVYDTAGAVRPALRISLS
ncbi:MAG: toll/interleukin-1 receptor domain-containing protein [Clostridia bacterium]|nr:toll/interleukin-1 receptor domain-containing protein [Clostridia bacterium]